MACVRAVVEEMLPWMGYHFLALERFGLLGSSGESKDAVVTAANETLSESLTDIASCSDHENVDHLEEVRS